MYINIHTYNFLARTRKVTINVDREKQYQNITGFGGSFTGSVSYILDKLPQGLQDHIYKYVNC